MIAIIDCDASDARPVKRAFDRIGADAVLVDAPYRIDPAAKIVIPPARSLPKMIRSLRDRRFISPVIQAVADGRPILGISQGMHLLFDVSYENGQHTGLGLVHGKVIRFEFGDHPAARHFVLPHEGWNQVNWTEDCPLTLGLSSGDYFYFRHDHLAEPLDRTAAYGVCNHGIDFTALVCQDPVFGTQFLPEKSEDAGLTLLANFARM